MNYIATVNAEIFTTLKEFINNNATECIVCSIAIPAITQISLNLYTCITFSLFSCTKKKNFHLAVFGFALWKRPSVEFKWNQYTCISFFISNCAHRKYKWTTVVILSIVLYNTNAVCGNKIENRLVIIGCVLRWRPSVEWKWYLCLTFFSSNWSYHNRK